MLFFDLLLSVSASFCMARNCWRVAFPLPRRNWKKLSQVAYARTGSPYASNKFPQSKQKTLVASHGWQKRGHIITAWLAGKSKSLNVSRVSRNFWKFMRTNIVHRSSSMQCMMCMLMHPAAGYLACDFISSVTRGAVALRSLGSHCNLITWPHHALTC